MIEERLNSLGIKLSDRQSSAVGSFKPVAITGNLAFVSGQIPIEQESNPIQVKYKGKVGRDISLEDGQAARLCVINGLSELKQALESLDKIKKFVKVSGYVNCDPSFTEHAKVINGASDFIVEVFGEKGKHARVSVGASSLALDSSVEVDFIVEV